MTPHYLLNVWGPGPGLFVMPGAFWACTVQQCSVNLLSSMM